MDVSLKNEIRILRSKFNSLLEVPSFRIILGRRIRIRREKNFCITPKASIGLIVKNIDMASPVLTQGVVRKIFSQWI
jgi:hypothetical protein